MEKSPETTAGTVASAVTETTAETATKTVTEATAKTVTKSTTKTTTQKTIEKDLILNGIHIGEHSFAPEDVKQEIYDRCIKPGYNFVTIRTNAEQVPQESFLEWAEYLAQNKIYFIFLYTVQHAPEGKDSQFTPETVAKMKEIAGEYFIGDMIGETGSSGACKMKGYFGSGPDKTRVKTDYTDMEAAHDGYVSLVSQYIETDKRLGMPEIVSVEATGLNKYNAKAGVTIPMLELMCGNPDILVSSLRGTARAIDSKMWGTYVAHEWYGGMRHDDTLKRKRLELAYKYAYLAGTNVLCLESGDELIDSYGHVFLPESDICGDYRRVLDQITDIIQEDVRPKGGPRVKVAFVSGLYDAWGGWGGSSIWNQFDREEWGHSEAEYSWRILDEIGTKRTWNDIANYGENDLSASPAYGMYDIVPIEADVDKLARYDVLIFLGWNSMTDENVEKLIQYVSRGGRLLMSAAHLNRSVIRGGKFEMTGNEKLKRLFGASFTGEVHRTNGGVKFAYNAVDEKILYPGTKSLYCDPVYSAGYTDYAAFELAGGTMTAFVSHCFGIDDEKLPAVIENRVGSGIATLVTSINYPGHPSLMPLYRMMVREFITASARECELKVLASDRLRYAVYEGGKIYLLNTDYDLPIIVRLIYNGREETVTLEPLELKKLEL